MSGGGSANSYDAVYNSRIAELMEKQQVIASEDRAWSIANERPYEKTMMEANLSMLPDQLAVQGLRMDNAKGILPGLYDTLGKHDVGEAMSTATADVTTGFNAAGKERDMRMKGLGVMPTSSAFQANDLQAKKAIGIASARTKARTDTATMNLGEKIQGLTI